ncbi:Methyltransferase domain-containing protein [Pleurostoma richardsiae]|uniref:Methyltransferase domain-containing protein n=1 Tax=Pleurostoma richardsiae TaxID=41990 RepID=A0AA38RSC8_9PEZI|nr:Methyltransferase domain-containing protein [Pleurostoma richardsiae]
MPADSQPHIDKPVEASRQQATPEPGIAGSDLQDPANPPAEPSRETGLTHHESRAPPDNESAGSLDAMAGHSVDLSVDSDRTDVDSSLGDLDTSSTTRSASSSIYEFVEQFGRTYHKYKEGKYYLPNDEQEQNRLDLQHTISRKLLNGKLGLAPAENAHRVLDLGTGTGIWAIDFAEENPGASVLGIDLSPIQPDHLPPNCQFEIDDAEDAWVWSQKFDYVHAKNFIPFIGDIPKLMRNIHDNLNPGGYVEMLEAPMLFRAVDNTLEGTPLLKWNNWMLEGVRRMGRNPLAALQLNKLMAEAGFVNITEKRLAVPINAWAKGAEHKVLGAMEMINLLEVAQGITMTVFTKALGWSEEEVEMLLTDVRNNLKDRSIHAYLPVVCIWAQRSE